MAKLRVLFLCTGNSCRSQMAEGWARRLNPDVIEPYSVGTHPKGIDPIAARVMAEAGAPIDGQQSKHVNDLVNVPFDYVITVCDSANEACPVFPGRARIIHHSFDDPPTLSRSASTEAERLAIYRRVRDEIRDYIKTMPAALLQSRNQLVL